MLEQPTIVSVTTPTAPKLAPAASAVPELATGSARPLPASRSRTRRRVQRSLWILLALGLGVSLALGLRPKPVGVEVAFASRGTLVVTVDEDGRTRVKDRYVVSAPLAGTLTRIALRPGDTVAQGAVVARLVPLAAPLLDPRAREEALARVAAARARVDQALAEVKRAREASAFAAREAERRRALRAAGAAAAKDEEEAVLAARMRAEELASAEFGRRVAESELRVAQAAMARLGATSSEAFPVRAPADGQVLRVLHESEGVVQPGAPLLEVGDPRALEVVVDVLTTDAVGIRPGAPVRIERWGGDSALRGHVHRVEPSAFTSISALGVEEQRVNVIVDLDEPRTAVAALGDAYRVEAGITVWEGRDRLLVPMGAVFRLGDGWATYVVEGERARLRPVRTGRRNASEVEVRRGLKPGDRVVLYPTDNVADAVRVEER